MILKELIYCFLVAVVIGAAINGFGTATPPARDPNAEMTPTLPTTTMPGESTVAEVNENNFKAEVLESSVPVLVDFHASWCAPCRQMGPIVEKVASEFSGKVKVVKVDVDSNSSLSAKYNIQSIPTFLIFKNGQRVDSYTGAVPKEDLVTVLNRQL